MKSHKYYKFLKLAGFYVMPNDNTPLPWVGIPAGLVAGMGDTALNYPAYGIKIRKQRGEKINLKMFLPKELYRGVITYGLSAIPITILQDGISTLIKSYDPAPSQTSDATAAFLGGCASAFVAAPMSNVIVTQQQQSMQPRTAIQSIINNYGYSRFWMGIGPTLMRDGPYALAAFWGTNAMKQYIEKRYQLDKDSNKAIIPASITTGAITTVLTQPVDTIATKMQDSHESSISAWKVAKDILKKEGFKGLYSGTFFRGSSLIGGMLIVSTLSTATKEFVTERYRKR
jgi:hypothetical protein